MENDNYYEEKFNIKISLYGEQIDFQINSDYNYFIKNICKIVNLSPEQIDLITLSYNDEDGDNIIITTEDDYSVFFEQVRQKIVNTLSIDINENSKFNLNKSLGSSLNNQNQINKSLYNSANSISKSNMNNNIYDSNESINKSKNKNSINESNDNIKNSNINNNIYNNSNISNNNNIISDNNNEDENILISDLEPFNDDIPIESIIFEYTCNSCLTYPIICEMYYCKDCKMGICVECKKKLNHNTHRLIKIETKDQLKNILKEENDKKNFDINKNYNHYNYNNNNPYSNYGLYNNYGSNNFKFNSNYNTKKNELPNYYHKENMEHINKKSESLCETIDYRNETRFKKMIPFLRRRFDLDGIDDDQLLVSLIKSNGNIDKAISSLYK